MAEKAKPIVTPKGRASFPQLFEAKAFGESTAKFSVQLLFDQKADLKALKADVNRAAKEKWGSNLPKKLDLPFKDGNDKELEGYEDTIVVTASSKFAPQVLDKDKTEIDDADTIYAGCYVKALVSAYAWEYSQKKGGPVIKRGVSFNLVAVQKVGEGERFVKRTDASEHFEDEDDGSSDESNYEDDDLFD